MPATATAARVAIEQIHVSAYKIPTDQPEADGTISWDSTTLVLVEIEGGGHTGLGYTYADEATAHLIHDKLAQTIDGRDVMNIPGSWVAMVQGHSQSGPARHRLDGDFRRRLCLVGSQSSSARPAAGHAAGRGP